MVICFNPLTTQLLYLILKLQSIYRGEFFLAVYDPMATGSRSIGNKRGTPKYLG